MTMRSIAFAFSASLMAILALTAKAPIANCAGARDTILGTSLSPAHVPYQSDRDIDRFFEQARQIGSHVTWIVEWESIPPMMYFQVIHQKAADKGLKFHLHLSPIALMDGRKRPAIPASIGGVSFSDPKVRQAYKDQVLTLASLQPDYLGLATEVNFLAQNPPEFAAFASLAQETYAAVKKQYPNQTVTISFQWDVMSAHKQFEVLDQFAKSLDVYSFTSYPDAFGDASKINVPDDFFTAVRKVLPTQRIGFSEIGWSSAPPSNEDRQAEFFGRMPELTGGARFEYVTLALLHDVSLFTGELERLNHVGIRTIDDAPKESWGVILNLPQLH